MRVHFILYVANQERSKAFYSAVLDMAPSLDEPGMTEFDLGDAVLGLMPEEGAWRLFGSSVYHPAAARGVPRSELYLLFDDAKRVHRRAVASGARELSPLANRDWGHKVGYSLDPDGHVLAVACVSKSDAAKDEPEH